MLLWINGLVLVIEYLQYINVEKLFWIILKVKKPYLLWLCSIISNYSLVLIFMNLWLMT